MMIMFMIQPYIILNDLNIKVNNWKCKDVWINNINMEKPQKQQKYLRYQHNLQHQ
jgi:hypothetical protein